METKHLPSEQDVQVGKVRVPNGLVLAPMAGATNQAFRMLCRKLGAGLTVTEMVSAKGLILGNSRTLHYLDKDPAEQPVGAQIFGDDPSFMAQAAKRVEDSGFHLVDVNMGCPVSKVTDDGGGCSLMKEPAKAGQIIEAMVRSVSIPVTVKIRAGWDEQSKNAPEMAKTLENAGASAVTVHGRTRAQKYSGKADWELIGKVKSAVKIPVFGNGDVDSPQKAAELMKRSGCDGVMIGRGALNRPWIFRDIQALRETGRPLPSPTREETGKLILELAEDLLNLYGEKTAVLMMRRYASDFSKGFTAGSEFRIRLMKVEQLSQLRELAEKHFIHHSTDEAFPAPAAS